MHPSTTTYKDKMLMHKIYFERVLCWVLLRKQEKVRLIDFACETILHNLNIFFSIFNVLVLVFVTFWWFPRSGN